MKKKLIQKKIVKSPRLNTGEVNFIYDICKGYLGKKNKMSIPGEIRHRVIFDYLRKNGCTGIFFKFLENTDMQIPEDFMEAYRAEYLAIEIKNTLYMKEAERVDEICRGSDIDYVMMKGAALIESVYKDKGVRPLSDIDLIVASREKAAQLIEGMQVKKGSGINFAKRYKDYVRMICPVYNKQYDEHFEIEVYFPVAESFYPLPELIFNISHRLFKKTHRTNNITVPDPSLHFLILLVHQLHHHLGARLIWSLDMACLVNENLDVMDWDVIIYECRRMEFKDALFHILQMLKTTFGVDIPERVLKEAGSKAGLNYGILEEMVSAKNVIMDSFGGGKMWLYPALSWRKLKTIILYLLFPFLFNDQTCKWYTFNLGNKKKKRIIGELASVTIFKHKYTGRKNLFKKIAGTIVVFVFSLVSLPVLIYYNLKHRPS